MPKIFSPTARSASGVVLVLFLISLAACGSNTPAASQILSDAQHAAWKDGTFAITFDETSESIQDIFTGSGYNTTKPQRSRFLVRATIYNKPVSIEMVQDGTTLYTATAPSTAWQKTPADHSPLGVDIASLFDLAQIQQVHLVGSETIQHVATYHLQGTATDATGKIGQKDLWVDQKTSLPIQIVLHQTTHPDKVAAVVTITFLQHNSGITVDVPVLPAA